MPGEVPVIDFLALTRAVQRHTVMRLIATVVASCQCESAHDPVSVVAWRRPWPAEGLLARARVGNVGRARALVAAVGGLEARRPEAQRAHPGVDVCAADLGLALPRIVGKGDG